MFDTTNVATVAPSCRGDAQEDDRLDRAKAFLDGNADGLINAAAWLGGERAGRAVRELITEIAQADRWQRRFTDRLCRLHSLLMLEQAHEPDHPTWHVLATTAPDDPRVEAICRQADAIRGLMDQS